MSKDSDFHPHVYPTSDGERSTAGSNYGDWRPTQPQRPHGYDFEARFRQPGRTAPEPADTKRSGLTPADAQTEPITKR